MRINTLELIRYGKFTDKILDFGARVKGETDFHIIYGPNEAGKSTIFSAWLDFLFGIETRSRYNFLHPYPAMRIGAKLEISGGPCSLIRIKRPQNSLLDGKDQPVGENLILCELNGLDRDSYSAMFSLDDETLEKGGENILASHGDLGQMLFSASAGLGDFASKLQQIQTEADEFHKGRVRSTKLAELKDRLIRLKDERDRIDILASDYARLSEAQRSSLQSYEQASLELGKIQSRIEELQRNAMLLPRLEKLRKRRADIACFAWQEEPPRHWNDKLPELRKDAIILSTRLETLRKEMDARAKDLLETALNDPILNESPAIDALQDLGARYRTALRDIPERQIQLREADAAISEILARIGRAGELSPELLILAAPISSAFRVLMERYSGVAERLRTAEHEVIGARHRLGEAEAKLKAIGGNLESRNREPAELASLATALTLSRAVDHEGSLRMARKTLAACEDTLGRRMTALGDWAGDIDAIAAMNPPERSVVADFKMRIEASSRNVATKQDAAIRLSQATRILKAERDTLRETSGLIDDAEISELRRSRDTAWEVHLHTLDRQSADAFEISMRSDDLARQRRYGHLADIAGIRQMTLSLAKLSAELSEAESDLDAAQREDARLRSDFRAFYQAFAPDMSDEMRPAELEAWLERRELAIDALLDVRAARRDISNVIEARDLAIVRLKKACENVGIACSSDTLEDLTLAAQNFVDGQSEAIGLRKSVEARASELSERERALEIAGNDHERWTRDWQDTCLACWLGENGAIPTLSTVGEILSMLEKLPQAIGNRASLADRIAKMELDVDNFQTQLSSHAESLEMQGADALVLFNQMTERFQKARFASEQANAKTVELEAVRKTMDEVEDRHAALTRQIAEMTDFFQVSTLDAVENRLEELRIQHELAQEAGELEEEILLAMGVDNIETVEARLGLLDKAALENELATLRPAFDVQNQRCRDLYAEFTRANDQLVSIKGDADVALIEEQRRTILLEIEDGARRYMRLRLGIAATETALRLYRDRHRSSMMAKASEAFRIVSRGAYTGLASQPDKDREILIAKSADGASKDAAELSKGTRFQLYLALRVAGYHEYATGRSVLPFIADDIMETFDDFRAEEAFRLFASMADVGQVIYLTHHRHLCDIARAVCPSVQIHHLDKPDGALPMIGTTP
jgi:uncharacterized protein YhaN